LLAQFWLMLGYSLAISLILPHYWYDPYMAVGKNIVLMVATLWLLGDEPRAREARG
ncbi:DoxX-like family protein, partial [Pseudomonas aeruginosa]|nr:DoxX-like family protein [Pseudomonas aeruginosa]HBO7465274.1 epimerase [Pseudomonas aeruginosa]